MKETSKNKSIYDSASEFVALIRNVTALMVVISTIIAQIQELEELLGKARSEARRKAVFRERDANAVAVHTEAKHSDTPESITDIADTVDPGTLVLESPEDFYALGSFGLRSNTDITAVVLPEGIAELPRSFFFGCSNLARVSLPQSLTAIGDYAFFGCERLKDVHIPQSVLRIGDYAFSYCESLKTANIPSGICYIGTAAFRNCEQLAELRLESADDLTALGSHAFQNCAMLSVVTLPVTLLELPVSLLYGCRHLSALYLPKSVERIGADVFCGCTALQRVSFQNPNATLMPNALRGLEKAELFLCDQRLRWREISEPTALLALLDTPHLAADADNAQ